MHSYLFIYVFGHFFLFFLGTECIFHQNYVDNFLEKSFAKLLLSLKNPESNLNK